MGWWRRPMGGSSPRRWLRVRRPATKRILETNEPQPFGWGFFYARTVCSTGTSGAKALKREPRIAALKALRHPKSRSIRRNRCDRVESHADDHDFGGLDQRGCGLSFFQSHFADCSRSNQRSDELASDGYGDVRPLFGCCESSSCKSTA